MRRPYLGTAPVTRPFGIVDPAYSNYPNSAHPGTDYGLAFRRVQVAAIPGKVTVIARGYQPTGRGNEAIITNGNTQVKYCHLDSFNVSNGDTVTEGQAIGLTGYSGYVLPPNEDGSHLHFEVLKNGIYVDPEQQYNIEEDIVKQSKEEVIARFKRHLFKSPTATQIEHYTTHDIRSLYQDILNQGVELDRKPTAQEVKDTFMQQLNATPTAIQIAHYTSKDIRNLYRDVMNTKPSDTEAIKKLGEIEQIINE